MMSDYTDMLQLGMEGSSRRHDALANNIANVDTPGYKREDVEFRSALREKAGEARSKSEMARTNPGHLRGRRTSDLQNNINHFKETGTSLRHDENNVDIEREMAELAKNEIYFNTLSQQLDARFNNLTTVIERSG